MKPWLLTAGVGLLMLFIAAGTVRSGLLLRSWTPRHNLLLSLPDNALRLALIGLCLVLGLTLGPGRRGLGWEVADLPIGLGAGIVLALALSLAGASLASRYGVDVYANRMVRLILPVDRREWAGVLVALLPAAALEELLFRWLPLAGLAWLVPPWWLLWPLALFFGLLHWPQGWWGVAGTALAGLAFSFLFLATGSLWPPLVAHYVVNLSQLLVARLAGLEPLRSA